MTQEKALRMALEFIERVNKDGWILADFEDEMYAVMTAINETLAQPKQEQAIISLTDQCAALVWERDELQKQVWLYEKNGVTC